MREEHPRPELVRENWLSLCGDWAFAFDFARMGTEQYFFDEVQNRFAELAAQSFDRKIRVPFCPESELSGVNHTDFIGACMYKKSVCIPEGWEGRILLNFEAAFYETHVVVGGNYLGSHKGGYTPFSFDVTDCIQNGKADIFVYCLGDSRNPEQPSGKQAMVRYGKICMYTRCTGIWAPVWLECVPDVYVKSLETQADPDNGCVHARLAFGGNGNKDVTLRAFLHGKEVGNAAAHTTLNELRVCLPLSETALWSPDDPALYDLGIEVASGGKVDAVRSYFGLRKIEWDKHGLILNGKRLCLKMVLDQGYYPDGLYTAPDALSFARDIALAQELGFNGARPHQKVFERRYLYECDKRGFLVWGEYPDWGFDHSSSGALQVFLPEWLESVERDISHPCVIGWCPQNETYMEINGNKVRADFTRQVYLETKRRDPSRPCIDASGGVHFLTDWFDVHEYFQDTDEFAGYFGALEPGSNYAGDPDLPWFLSEYGGTWLREETATDDKKPDASSNAAPDEREFIRRFTAFADTLLSNPRVAGFCYTQLYDVEQEKNGLYRFDRSPRFSEKALRAFREALSRPAASEKVSLVE